MVTKVRGAFNDIAGYAIINPEDPAGSEIEIRVQLASVDTRNDQRDEHLRSADFFDVEHHPEMVFTATSVDEIEENNYVVVGELTIRDITRPITMPLQLRSLERDPLVRIAPDWRARGALTVASGAWSGTPRWIPAGCW